MDKMVYRHIKRIALGLIPTVCVVCDGSGINGQDLCIRCEQELPFNTSCCSRCAIPLQVDEIALCGACLRRPLRYQTSYCVFEYRYPVAHLVRALKYGYSLSHARVLGTLLANYLLHRHASDWPRCVIPVPLSSARYCERGFNQAIELGRVIEQTLGIPMDTHLLERVRHTVEQAGLSRRERRKNLRNAFEVTTELLPKHIAILDDVVTTGSTVNEIARTLRRSGVTNIEVWAIARAPLR